MRSLLRSTALLLLASGCATTPAAPPTPPPALPVVTAIADPAVAAAAAQSAAVLLRGGRIMTAAGDVFDGGHVLLVDGKIADVGPGAGSAPAGAVVVDATGKVITPGLIDTHSHMGVYPLPGSNGNGDGNEATSPTTPGVWAEHSFWPQDPALPRALASGITTIQVLPGSANLIGGRSFVAKLKLGATSARAMRFPDAPQGLKMACGENPKRVYGSHGAPPQTRMGNVLGYRRAFQAATEYRRRWHKYDRDLALWNDKQAKKKKDAPTSAAAADAPPDDPPEPPGRDFDMETLSLVLDGKILVHNHCYRADEMNIMLDLAHQYGFHIRSFHHAVEAYKLRDRLAAEGVSVSTWADWWGFKMESYDGVPQNAPLLAEAGARAIIHSDSESEIRHLNQEAAKAAAAGVRIGVATSENEMLRWVTANPAWALGVDDKVGTLEKGKMADVVVWDRDPFSVYAKVEQVYIDGALQFDRATQIPSTDFEVGTGVVPPGGAK